MKSFSASGSFRPFEALGHLVERNALRPEPDRPRPARDRSRPPASPPGDDGPVSDEALFRSAMTGVVPIGDVRRAEKGPSRRKLGTARTDPDRETVRALRRLVEQGTGFVVSQTAEYVEGTGRGVHPEMARRLHRGRYAIQAHLDLHGHTVDSARAALDRFLKRCTGEGLRGVLIVHGRGRSSPAEPVLKTRVFEWLSRGPWRKWVMAFCSARLVDGGAGATCVLLRERPLTRWKRPQKAESR